MKIHYCFVTRDRIALTMQAIESFLATVSCEFTMMVADNNSADGTQSWLAENEIPNILFPGNRYPGYACNRAWEYVPADADFLGRGDNDFCFLEGWSEEAERCFQDPLLGQLGLRTEEEEPHAPMNVGGNNIIRRTLWDAGLRYDERPWPEYPPGYSEDSYLSPLVVKMGWRWGRVACPCIRPLDQPTWDSEYYRNSFQDRNMGHRLRYAK